MDIVFISELRVDTVIGVYDWEREIRQTVVLNLEMACDNTRAARSDAIADAVDYAAISDRVQAFIEASEFQLIETMAEQLAALVIAEFDICWLRLRLSKPGAVARAKEVGVQIERGVQP